jgi:hypothetical protein
MCAGIEPDEAAAEFLDIETSRFEVNAIGVQ